MRLFINRNHLSYKARLKQLILSVLFFTTYITYSQSIPQPDKTIQKFGSVLQLINYFYVDTMNLPKLTEYAIIGMLKELDPHSVYLTKEELAQANEPLIGNFDGIGVQFQLFHDTITIVAAIPNGPSDKLGIRSGDKIIKINDEDAFGKKVNNKFVFDRLRGKRGSKVKISIFRKGSNDLLEYVIERDKIPINSIDAHFMLDKETGYIKLARFARTSLKEFIEAYENLSRLGMGSLILDLRNNTGGYLDIAVELSDQFLQNNKLIVYTEGVHSPRQNLYSTNNGHFKKGKLIVMVNQASASASEIVAGAIQDLDRGLIVGRRTFGKGLVQRPFMLPDSSSIRLTTARYYTPSGRSIQRPYENGVDDYYSDYTKRFKHGELVSADSIKFPDSLKYYTTSNRCVYGGGGIMPDIFIPIDTNANSKYFIDVSRKNLLNDFTIEYCNENRNKLLEIFKTKAMYKEGFDADKTTDDFIKYATKNGVEKNQEEIDKNYNDIKYILKGLIARTLYSSDSYYEMILPIDMELLKAKELIKDDSIFKKYKLHD